MGYMILDYIIGFADAALLFYFVSRFLKIQKSGWKTVVFSLVLITIINNVTGIIFGNGNLLATFVMMGGTGVIYKFLFRDKLFNIFLYFFLGIVLMFVAEGIAILAILPFGITPNDVHSSFIALLLAGGISKTVYYLIVRYFVPKLRMFKGISKTKAYQLLLICIFNTIIIFMALWFYKNAEILMIKEHSNAYIILTTLAAMIFSIGILSITRGIIKQSQKEAEWLVQETEYKRQMFYVNNIEDMLKSIKAQRHDFNNHVSCIYGLLQMNKLEEAREYIKRLSDEASVYNSIIDTGNPILSSLLNTKITSAERNRVVINTDVRMPEKTNIEPIDISIIIGNLLDNALEACAAAEEEGKNIDLEVYSKNHNLIIKLSNTKSEQVTIDAVKLDEGFTSKEDSDNHGFGLRNIKQTVNKYGGFVKFEDKGSTFHSNIAIPIK